MAENKASNSSARTSPVLDTRITVL